ncbi:DUF58 domain-containing protein [Bifidobacterium saguinibicoloris]|uniref:DUF58 domain-containing protein n=1 Tax=Bifidobacterium saguinibicoloris TaxID=2834433 RepID=UPI001C59BB21|nr:DUF58 domain-containing protein [Bifidobacterium saguinibicoloris]MBW3080626.1 DUF58 domain-containing protein [Bifidobacterium saguinibicoloris]
MIGTRSDDPVRARIEALGTRLSLPTVRRALGVIEGEHGSRRAGGSDELMDVRAYEPGDEARLIEWKTSARQGRPMVVRRERLVTSRVWMMLDVGREMTGSCVSGERAFEVAANALRMFAALSLRRSDDISLVLSDAASITRVPFNGGFPQFERVLDEALDRDWSQPRNIDALLAYARRIRDRDALVVIATDEHALDDSRMKALRSVARTHPLVVIDVATVNPFAAARSHEVLDGAGRRRLPAFLADPRAAAQVDTHRAYMAAALRREMDRVGGHVVRADSSEAMFDEFVRLVSRALAGSGPAGPRMMGATSGVGGAA